MMVTIESAQLESILQQIDRSSSPQELVDAVQCLSQLQTEAAIPTLIKVLGFNNPRAAVIAMGGLIQLGSTAVPQLLALMDDYNYSARAYTIRALATIADPRALDCLIHCALYDFAPSVRRAAIKGLGNVWRKQPSPEFLSPILATLQQMLEDEDWSMRYATIVALSTIPTARPLLHKTLDREQDKVVRARLHLALAS